MMMMIDDHDEDGMIDGYVAMVRYVMLRTGHEGMSAMT